MNVFFERYTLVYHHLIFFTIKSEIYFSDTSIGFGYTFVINITKALSMRDYKSIFLNKDSSKQLENFLENVIEAEFTTIKFSKDLYYVEALDLTQESIQRTDEFACLLARNET